MSAILRFVAISILIIFGIAFGLILSQWPSGEVEGQGLNFPQSSSDGSATDIPLQTYMARDGAVLGYREIEGDPANTTVLVHGSGWHSAAYMDLAAGIAAQTGGRVVVPDLRGHGPLADPRGDTDYVAQLEDDLADLLDHFEVDQASLVGHSSGGGLVIRFAGGVHGTRMTRAALLAPFLKYNAPTVRPNSGGWARPLTRRLIGLLMLNGVGITALNGLTVIEFNLPDAIRATVDGQSATQSYSYRLNTGFAPRPDFGADIAALPEFLLVVGEADEAFIADQFAPTMSEYSDLGTYDVLPDLGHLDTLFNQGVAARIGAFLSR